MTKDEEFEVMRSILDQTSLSPDDRNFMLSMLWTCDELPEIQSHDQFKEYGRLYDEVNGRMQTAGIMPGMPEFSRSPDGLLATALVARIVEWQDRNKPDNRRAL